MLPLCAVLDLDDTLFLERDYVRSGFEAVAPWVERHFPIRDFCARALRAFQAGRRRDVFNAVFRDCGLTVPDSVINDMVRIYRRHSPTISLLPDAAAFIDSSRGVVKLALVSDGPIDAQRRKLRALRLDYAFDLVVFTDFWGHQFCKPHPRAFSFIQSRLGRRLEYLYVGDNPHKDFDAPAALNWKTIRVRRPEGLHSSCEPAGRAIPTFEIPDLTVLSGIVRRAGRPSCLA